VVRAWDFGSGPVDSWAMLLNVLSTCQEWDRLAQYLNETTRDFTTTTLDSSPARLATGRRVLV
jgi:hypothetical protein